MTGTRRVVTGGFLQRARRTERLGRSYWGVAGVSLPHADGDIAQVTAHAGRQRLRSCHAVLRRRAPHLPPAAPAPSPRTASRSPMPASAAEATGSATPAASAGRRRLRTPLIRLRWPQRVFSQVLLMQLAIATGVTALVTAFFLAPLSDELDDRAMDRALAIAQTTAAEPGFARHIKSGSGPSVNGPVQHRAEQIRKATGAGYVVVMDENGIRWSHPEPGRVGEHVSTDPSAALAGHEVRHIDEGTLGRSARGKVPLRDEQRRTDRRRLRRHRLRRRTRQAPQRGAGAARLRGRRTRCRRARRTARIAAVAAADPRPGLLRHLFAAGRAGSDAARHPGGRRRPGRTRTHPARQRRGTAAA